MGQNSGSLRAIVSLDSSSYVASVTGTPGQIVVTPNVGDVVVSIDPAFVSTSIIGTANQVYANGVAGSPQAGIVTLTTPQNIDTTANPVFASLNLTTANSAIKINGDNAIRYPLVDTSANGTSIAIGPHTIENWTSGNDNVAIGYQSQQGTTSTTSSNILGQWNTSVGYQTLQYMNSGTGNTAVGWQSQKGDPSAPLQGTGNTSLGYLALTQVTYGGGNMACGGEALRRTTTGFNNMGLGLQALANNISGSRNVGLGFIAGAALTTGNNNLMLGALVGSNTLSTGSGNILIGSSASIDTPSSSTNNYLAIGNSTVPVIKATAIDTLAPQVTIGGTIVGGVWNGGIIGLAYGGTNGALIANNGGIVWSDVSQMQILAGTATASKMLLSGATTTPSWSTSTIPTSAGATANKVLLSDGTNYVLSTPTFPNASASVGKFIRSDGTNWIASTPTLPVSAGTSGKVLQSNGTNYVESTPTYPSASGSSGKVIISDGTNNIYSTPTYPNSASGTGTILRADGTNWVATTTTYPNTNAINTLLYASSANVMSALATANSSVLITNGSGVPAWATSTSTFVTSITGTANQITASAATGAITLSTPQDIGTNSNVQFRSIGLGSATTPPINGIFTQGQVWINSTSPTNNGLLDITTIAGSGSNYTVAVSGTWRGLDTGNDKAAVFIGPTDNQFHAAGITNSSFLYIQPNFSPASTTTITKGMGLYIDGGSYVVSGAITNGHPLYVKTATYGTNKFTAVLGDSNAFLLGIGTATFGDFGGGSGVISILNAGTVPTTNPSAGGILYCSAGALKYRGSAGTVTNIANA